MFFFLNQRQPPGSTLTHTLVPYTSRFRSYECNLMRGPSDTRADLGERSVELLLDAQAAVGGEVVSGGGTGTWEENRWVSELQAGSYCLMDTEYTPHAAGFEIGRASCRERVCQYV